MELTHLDDQGRARMVDVSAKPATERYAAASAYVRMDRACLAALAAGRVPKGDAFAVARVAGIQAAKRASDLIPLCHGLALGAAGVEFEPGADGVAIRAWARCVGPTGVEMEALAAASVAALALYDMCKALDKGMEIGPVRLEEKTGGKSGDYRRPPEAGSLASVNVSAAKGEAKTPVPGALLRAGHGIEGDAHAGSWHRQLSLLSAERIAETARASGHPLKPGDFAENLTVAGLDLGRLAVGSLLEVGPCLIEITQIGKECHTDCAIRRTVGDCVMPREGLFARVLEGGAVAPGDRVRVSGRRSPPAGSATDPGRGAIAPR